MSSLLVNDNDQSVEKGVNLKTNKLSAYRSQGRARFNQGKERMNQGKEKISKFLVKQNEKFQGIIIRQTNNIKDLGSQMKNVINHQTERQMNNIKELRNQMKDIYNLRSQKSDQELNSVKKVLVIQEQSEQKTTQKINNQQLDDGEDRLQFVQLEFTPLIMQVESQYIIGTPKKQLRKVDDEGETELETSRKIIKIEQQQPVEFQYREEKVEQIRQPYLNDSQESKLEMTTLICWVLLIMYKFGGIRMNY